MAAINVTINGVIIDKYGRTISGPISVVGEMMYSDLGVGGGPIVPPPGGGVPPWEGVGKPPEVTHPIWPPRIPGHPLPVPPDPPTQPPIEPPTQPPSENWVWGFVPDGSGGGVWSPVFVPEGGGSKPQPLPPPG